VSVAIVESGDTFGGNHTWSSFASDLSPEGAELAAPLIAHRWPEYQIRFPDYERHLPPATNRPCRKSCTMRWWRRSRQAAGFCRRRWWM
jgi:hypothetical protein